MNCEEINDLLAPYALDALEQGAAIALREHLVTCRRHDDELSAHMGVIASLALAASDQEPATELQKRLLDAFDDEVSMLGTMARMRSPIVALPLRRSFALTAAAVLVLAVVGLTTWNIVLQTRGGEPRADVMVSVNLAGAGVDGHLWYMPEQHLAVVSMEQMPLIQAGHVLQAWGIHADRTVSLGVLAHEPMVAIKADLDDATMFAITEEPMGGSNQPTGDPLATAKLN